MEKKRIAVIFGGKSSEHEVSRVSASYIISVIPKDEYEVYTIGITKKGRWFLYSGDVADIADGSWEKHPDNKTAFIAPAPSVHGMVVIDKDGNSSVVKLDVIFPVLHGKNGEDGTIQGLFEMSGMPYVGCGVLASSACMDKIVTNIMLDYAGIDQAGFVWFTSYDFRKDPDACVEIVEKAMNYPVFVKPANAGSSVGITKAHDRSEFLHAVDVASAEDTRILVEENIVGKEVECAVIGNEEPFASVLGEIAPSAEFYDYDAKYNSNASKLFIPARLDDELTGKVKETAVKAYKALCCEGLSRVDFFVTEDGRVMLNEINTLPGFTSISMYPKLMAESGKSGSKLIEELIALAFERADRNV